MNPLRLELSLDLLRAVNEARRKREQSTSPVVRIVWERSVRSHEAVLEQHDADARARVDVRQTSIFPWLRDDAPE